MSGKPTQLGIAASHIASKNSKAAETHGSVMAVFDPKANTEEFERDIAPQFIEGSKDIGALGRFCIRNDEGGKVSYTFDTEFYPDKTETVGLNRKERLKLVRDKIKDFVHKYEGQLFASQETSHLLM